MSLFPDLKPYIVDGPQLVFLVSTSEFPTNPLTPVALARDSGTNQFAPNTSTYTTATLAAYTQGAVSITRTPTINSFNFNELASEPAIQRYASEAVSVAFQSPTVFYTSFLQNVAGIYAQTVDTGSEDLHIFYGGNNTLTTSLGIMLVGEKQESGKPYVHCVPNILITAELTAALEKGQIAQSNVTITALPSATRKAWWMQNTFVSA